MISVIRPPWSNGLALAILLATPVATALSRNIAFPILVFATVLVVLTSVQTNGLAKSWATLKQSVCQIMTSSLVGPLAIATVLFALASLFWAPGVERGLGAAAQTTAAALSTAICCILMARHAEVPGWMAWALSLSVGAASVVVLVELYLGYPIRSALGASLEPYRLNRSAVAIALLLPLLFFHVRTKNRLIFAISIAFLPLTAILLSQSESAKFAAYTIAASAALTMALKPRFMALFVGLVILASHVLAPAVALALYASVTPEAVASLSTVFTTNSNHFIRLEIWWAYAQQVFSAPLFGHGLQASFWAGEAYKGTDPVMIRGLAFSHPHNVSLQIWYELGLVGVVLSTAMMAFLLRQIIRLQDTDMRVAAILMASVWAVAYVSHGAWQGWWWALVGIIIIQFTALSHKSDRPA